MSNRSVSCQPANNLTALAVRFRAEHYISVTAVQPINAVR